MKVRVKKLANGKAEGMGVFTIEMLKRGIELAIELVWKLCYMAFEGVENFVIAMIIP